MIRTDCIPQDELERFNAGLIDSDRRISEINRHLEACAQCIKTLDLICAHQQEPSEVDAFASELPPDAPDIAFARAKASNDLPPDLPEKIGKFRVEDFIGSGGMAHVYSAIQPGLERPVVVKLLKSKNTDEGQSLDLFKQEMAILGQLDNPAIVRAIDVGDHEGRPFIVMEYISGRTLAKIIRQDGPMPVRTACRIMSTVAEALITLHGCGVVHRDIKPSNIMASSDGKVKVIDLGIAHFFDGATQTRAGTPAFMAPEQAKKGVAVDQRADLFSFGATLYFLLTGLNPSREHFQNNRRLNARSVPRKLRRTILRLLSSQPSQRFQTVNEFIPSIREYASPLTTRWQTPVACLAVLALVAIGGLLRVHYFSADSSTNSRPTEWSLSDRPPAFPGLATLQTDSVVPYQVETTLPRRAIVGKWRPNRDEMALLGAPGKLWLMSYSKGGSQLRAILPGSRHYYYSDVAWNRDGRYVSSTGLATAPIFIWEADAGKQVGAISSDRFAEPTCIQWSPHADELAIGDSEGIVRVFDVTGNLAHEHDLSAHNAARDLDWHPVEDRLAVLTESNRLISLDFQDPASPANVSSFEAPITAVDWHPNGDRLAILEASDSIHGRPLVRLLNVDHLAKDETLEGLHGQSLSGDVAWSRDGSILAACAFNTVAWRDGCPQAIELQKNSGVAVQSLDWQNGQLMWVGHEGVHVWQPESSEVSKAVAHLHNKVFCVEANPRETACAISTTEGTVRLIDANGRLLWIDQCPLENRVDLSWSPDGTSLFGAAMGFVFQWNADTGERIRSIRIDGAAHSLSCSHDGRLLVVAGDHISLWTLPDVEQTDRIDLSVRMWSVQFAPDCLQFVGTDDVTGGVHLYNVSATDQIEEAEILAPEITSEFVRWSPDGREILAVDQDAWKIHVIDTQDGSTRILADPNLRPCVPSWSAYGVLCGMVGVLDGHGIDTTRNDTFRRNFAFSWLGGGRTIIGGNWRGDIRGYDAKTLEQKWLMLLTSRTSSAVISNAGQVLAGNRNGVRYVVEVQPRTFETVTQSEFERRYLRSTTQ